MDVPISVLSLAVVINYMYMYLMQIADLLITRVATISQGGEHIAENGREFITN